jgi:hypothetical protein
MKVDQLFRLSNDVFSGDQSNGYEIHFLLAGVNVMS